MVKLLEGSEVKSFGTHTIPTVLTQKTISKGSQTTIKYSNVIFDQKLDESFFTQQTLKKPVRD